MTCKTYTLIWQEIEIEARYEVDSCCSDYSHLEIISIKPFEARLPMTETGYRSHFHPKGMIERDYGGDVVACVVEWLDEEAKSKRWQSYVEAKRQFTFF